MRQSLSFASGLFFRENGVPYYFCSDLLQVFRLSQGQAKFVEQSEKTNKSLLDGCIYSDSLVSSSDVKILLDTINNGISNRPESFSIPFELIEQLKIQNVGIVPTMACNMNCNYCYLKASFTKPFLNPKKMNLNMARAVTKWSMYNIPKGQEIGISFIGGEPLLVPNIIHEVLKYGKQLTHRKEIQVSWSITTNGSLLNKDILNMLFGYGVQLNVSLDGPEKVHNHYRRKVGGICTHDSVENGVLEAIFRYPELVKINVTVTDETVSHWDETINYLRKFPVKKVLVFCYDGAVGRPSQKSRRFVIREIVCRPHLYEDFRLMTVSDKLEILRKKQPVYYGCPAKAAIRKVYVTPEGNIYPCYNLFSAPDYCLGNVNSYGFGRRGQEMRYAFLMKDISNSNNKPCFDCWARWLCAGGCPSRNVVLEGEILPQTKNACINRRSHYEMLLRAFVESDSCNINMLTNCGSFHKQSSL